MRRMKGKRPFKNEIKGRKNMLKQLFNQYEEQFISESSYQHAKDLEVLIASTKAEITSLEEEEYRTGVSYLNTISKLEEKLSDAKRVLASLKSSEEITEKVHNQTYDQVAAVIRNADEMKKILPDKDEETVTLVSQFLTDYLPDYLKKVEQERNYDSFDEDEEEKYDNCRSDLDEIYSTVYEVASRNGAKGLKRLQAISNSFQKAQMARAKTDELELEIMVNDAILFGNYYFGEDFLVDMTDPEKTILVPSQIATYMVNNASSVSQRQPLEEVEQKVQEERRKRARDREIKRLKKTDSDLAKWIDNVANSRSSQKEERIKHISRLRAKVQYDLAELERQKETEKSIERLTKTVSDLDAWIERLSVRSDSRTLRRIEGINHLKQIAEYQLSELQKNNAKEKVYK